MFMNVYVEDSAANGIDVAGGAMFGCVSASAGGYGLRASSSKPAAVIGCLVSGAADDGILVDTAYPSLVAHCTSYGSVAGSGIKITHAYGAHVTSCALTGNNQYGLEVGTAPGTVSEDYNAYYNNGVNETSGVTPNAAAAVHVGLHSVTLTGDPFTNAAGGDFSLDATAGEGAACRAAGFGALLDGVNIGYPDIGALQHQDAGGGGLTPHMEGAHVQ